MPNACEVPRLLSVTDDVRCTTQCQAVPEHQMSPIRSAQQSSGMWPRCSTFACTVRALCVRFHRPICGIFAYFQGCTDAVA